MCLKNEIYRYCQIVKNRKIMPPSGFYAKIGTSMEENRKTKMKIEKSNLHVFNLFMTKMH
jgi:hypothetical protein